MRLSAGVVVMAMGLVAGCGNDSVPAATASCTDGVQNGDETDVDCGGATCGKCVAGKGCHVTADCTPGVCLSSLCAPAACVDGIKNGDETDVDCGGSCAKCSAGRACAMSRDCTSGVCTGGSCAAPACADGAKNGDESDVDCGGACPPCAIGKACLHGTDCVGGDCMNNVCVVSCFDSLKNGSETDVDCGGGACPMCIDGKACAAASDCASGVCAGNLCVMAACADGTKNGKETAVDCGGPDCGPCPDKSACARNADCQSGLCVDSQCQPPSCADKVKNGSETDVDCGGQCPPCGVGLGCAKPADCWNQDCDGGNHCSGGAQLTVGSMQGGAMFDPSGDGSKLVVLDKDGNVTVDRASSLLAIARYIYVSNSGEGTVSKIDPNTQKEVARYCTAPGCNANPSRASVSLDGDVGVANRANYFYGGALHPERASAVKIAGDLSRCVDRNGNGKIDTWVGAGPVPQQFQWPANTSVSPDECVLWFTQLVKDRNGALVGGAGTLPRSATFDSKSSPDGSLSSNFYVGLYGTSELAQLDSKTGAIKQQIAVNAIPYSSVFDRFGFLWIKDANGPLMRVDTNNNLALKQFPAPPCSYAISADRRGYIYGGGSNCVARMDPSAQNPSWESLALPNACFTRGVSLDADFNLWVPDTCYGAFHVDASKPFGMGMVLKKAINLPLPNPNDNTSGYYLGSAIDGTGFPWIIGTQTSNLSAPGGPAGKVFRIDPGNNYALTPVSVGATPYVYSDLSGSQLALTAPTTGSFRKTFPAFCGSKATWTQLTWTDVVPAMTTVQIRYRAAKDLVSLQTAPFVTVGTELPAIMQPVNVALPQGTDPSFFQVEFVIATSDTQNKPTLSAVSVAYTCPM